jgi:hypothetical protein
VNPEISLNRFDQYRRNSVFVRFFVLHVLWCEAEQEAVAPLNQVTVKLDCDEGPQPKGPRHQESNHQAITVERGAPNVGDAIHGVSLAHTRQRPVVYLKRGNTGARLELAKVAARSKPQDDLI